MTASPITGPRLALAAILAAFAALLVSIIGAVPGGSDSSGYFNEAKLFAGGSVRTPARSVAGLPPGAAPHLYVPLGFRSVEGDPVDIVPTYPPGLPLLLAAAAAVTGWDNAGAAVLVAHSLAGLLLLYALGRRCGLPGYWSAGGVLLVAASPLYLFISAQALSDVPAMTWATAAVVAALASEDEPMWALGAGFCVGFGFLIRPTNLLVALPVVAAVGFSPRRLALAAAGALPCAVGAFLINRAAYGSGLQSGYGEVSSEFHASAIAGTLVFYLRWLPVLLGPSVLLLPALPFLRGQGRRVPAVLVVWAGAFMAFYCSYRWTQEAWWFLRFLLPATPALVVGGLLAAHRILGGKRKHSGAWGKRVPAILLSASLAVQASQVHRYLQAFRIGRGERKYGLVADYVRSEVPRDAVLVVSQVSGALFYHTDLTLVRLDWLDPHTAKSLRASLLAAKRPLYAVVFPFERDRLAGVAGTWTTVGNVDDVTLLRSEQAAGP
jgi:hypothetical protein